MPAILEINALNKAYKDFRLNDVSLSLERGYIMGFIGPNGAGKSTTIKLIMNLMRRDSGDIRVFGLDNITHEKDIKERIGFVYDENVYYEELTVMQMKRVVAPFYKRWDDARFMQYIREFELPRDKKIKALSKGIKLKFALAIALSHGAELLIMDEPTSGLDPLVRSELLEILTRELRDGDKAVFFSTHITSDLDKVADYITLINDGGIVFSRTKDDIVEGHGLVKGARDLLDGSARRAFIGIKENAFGFEGLARDRKEARRMFGEGVVIERPTLEEVMLYYTRRNQDA